MKYFRSLLRLALLMITVSCTETDRAPLPIFDEILLNPWNGDDLTIPNYDGLDGGILSQELADRWLQNYQYIAGRDGSNAFYFGSEEIQKTLAEQNCTGLRFFYAIDDENQLRVLMCGVDRTGSNILLADQSILVSSFSHEGGYGQTSRSTANIWINNYIQTKTFEDINYYYFGKEVIQLVVQQNNCIAVKLYNAKDDLGNERLLVVGISQSDNASRTQSGGNHLPLIADFSFPCPSYCGNGNDGF